MKFLKYFPHIVFALALSYFGFLAFLLEKDPMMNKMIMVMICGFWILWIFAKSLIKIMAAIVLLGAMAYAGYYVMNAKEIECKKAGREWNAKLEVCEDKKTMGEKLKSAVSNGVKNMLQKLKDEKVKKEEKVQSSQEKENEE